MKGEKVISCLWSILLGFVLSFSGCMWLVSAFSLGVDVSRLMICCAVAAVVCSVCYTLPLSGVPLGAGALLMGYLWQQGTLEASVEAILNRLSRQYDKAYGWGIIRWGLRTADDMEPTMVTVLCILGVLTAMAVAFSVCRRKSIVPVFLSLSYVASCFVVNDTVPDSIWIYLLLTGGAVLLLTGTVRRQDAAQANRLCLVIVPLAALAMLVMMAAVPRQSYQGQDRAKALADRLLGSETWQRLTGSSDPAGLGGILENDTVDLKTVGYRIESKTPVMTVTAPYTGVLYLRGRAMNAYDGTSWSNTATNDASLYWPNQFLETVGEVQITTRFAHRMLYTPYYLQRSQMRTAAAGMENDKFLKEYSFTCKRPVEGFHLSGAILLSSGYQQPNVSPHIHLPQEVLRWAQPLAQKLTGATADPTEKARLIADYVRNSAGYDTYTARMPGGKKDFAQWFLNNSDTGYCVHFATATAVLLQAAGIPARYVTGYMVPVSSGQPTEVLSSQAHAWVEYWLAGFGWVVLESTPAAQTQSVPTDAPEQPTGDETQTSAPTQSQQTEGAEQTQPSGQTATPNAPGQQLDLKSLTALLLTVAAVCLVVIAVIGQRAVRRALWQRKLEPLDNNARALMYWQEAERLAALLKQTPDDQLLQLAQMAKFSQHNLTPEQLDCFIANRDAAVKALKSKGLLHRFYYRYILAVY